MARGKDKHMERLASVNALGTPLSKRSKSKCEFCDDRSSLRVYEVPPVPEEPAYEAAILLCDACSELLNIKKYEERERPLHFLVEKAWSEIRPVQLASVRILYKLADLKVAWAQNAVADLYLDPEIEADL